MGQVDKRPLSFATFFDENYVSVCRGLSMALGEARRAEEAAQEAFTRAYARWRRFSQMDRPAGWVYVTAVRVATRRRDPPAVRAERRSVDDVANVVVQRALLAEAIDQLPERQRLAIVLRYGLDLSLDDVAAAIGSFPRGLGWAAGFGERVWAVESAGGRVSRRSAAVGCG
jgi:RNA polymerase sigma-70 factor (ECF subfamily)